MKFQEIHHYMNYQLNLEATIVLNRKVTFGSKYNLLSHLKIHLLLIGLINAVTKEIIMP